MSEAESLEEEDSETIFYLENLEEDDEGEYYKAKNGEWCVRIKGKCLSCGGVMLFDLHLNPNLEYKKGERFHQICHVCERLSLFEILHYPER